MNMLMWLEDFVGEVPAPAILKPRPIWIGKQVFGLVIPKQINFQTTPAWHSESERGNITPVEADSSVMIQKGEHLLGTLCKDAFGMSTHGLTYVIWKECGPDAACKFLGNAQLLVHYWFLHNAFSIGIGDMIVLGKT
ncbi:hypothetical protein TB2_026436 [Malus domestica]